MSIRVRIEHGQGAGTTWRLTQPGVYVLGRAKTNSIQILDMKVSKEHCEIHVGSDGKSAVLHDLGSTHGAMVNGQPLNGDGPIKPGDELRLGLMILRILSDGEADHDIAPFAGRNMDETSVDTSSDAPDAPTMHSLPPDALVGVDLGGYLIEKKIGAGGMGGVYLAEQVSLRRKVALKVLNERFGSDSAFVDQFVNEARAAGALNHPNVVQVYDVGSARGNHFFSMEVMPGGSIEDRVKAHDTEWQEALNWFIDASNALIFAHKKEILHRDVKPDNLMLAEDGSAKLCDLGLAKKSENADLMAQGIIGTPHFISPEAIRRKPDVNHRTDLYSLGCSFYRILTGKNPYPGKTVKEILLGHLNKPVPRVSDSVDGIPRDLDDVVHKLMQKDPDDRFQTPEELLAALDKVRLRHGLEAHGIKPHSRKPIIIAAAVAAIAIGVGIFFAMKDPGKVVVPKTAKELEEIKRNAIASVRNAVDQAKLEPPQKFIAWGNTVRETKLLSSGDQWKDPTWVDFIQGIRDSAAGWTKTAGEWNTQVGEQEHDEAADILREGATFMTEQAEKAEKLATNRQQYIDKRKNNESAIAKARELANKELDAAIAKRLAVFKAAFAKKGPQDKQAYVDAALALRADDIEEIIKSFRGRTQKEVVLLADDEIDERVAKAFGKAPTDGSFKGFYKPKDLGIARDELRTDHSAKMKELQVPSTATVDELKASVAKLREYLEVFPAAPDPRAGVIATVLTLQREDIEKAIQTSKNQWIRRVRADILGDRAGCQDLIRTLFAPQTAGGNGNLRRLRFLDANLDINSFVASAKTPEYKMVGAHLARAVAGMKAAFERAASTFSNDWVDTKFYYVDQKDKQRTKTFKDVTAQGCALNKDKIEFGKMGPAWLLEHLFFVNKKPRFVLEGDEMLGLATLAELAGDFDLARTTYEAYATGVEGDVKAGVQWRLGALGAEAKAAGLWKQATGILREVEAFLRTYSLDDPNSVFDAEKEFRAKLQQAMTIRQQMQDDREVASTLWGAAVRVGKPHPDASFAGESLPADPDPRGPPPRDPKPGDKKKPDEPKKAPNDKAPGKKDPPVENGGKDDKNDSNGGGE